ncbi:MAG: hypothetical protein P5702_16045 [Limnospira sp. PMC 1291.21]|uniref:Uncharacterized protein n=1 Tax=Limnospira fusiformis PMC 851.14 TaxID=2219512 RepID=A0ABU9ETR3_LIMFS|nr:MULTISPECIES: hypothetical protein [unclassified Limnospira]MDT9220490.1 hypothetical protein [Limnospira sp. PMC 1240.20]MDT9328635.1 hypothetical protein [Limnospira sp. PMC 1286.21]MDT9180669.1 hypothetical protein [Limnospira sp. PMC 1238.20]MDT9206256.1 hypothetical protein [Limnospira sp. PMC 1243.20]MDT9210075.1 hypothetical protein [Limnospira sp. PMC 1252.20]
MLISPNPMQYSVNLGDRTPDYTGKMPVLHEERSHCIWFLPTFRS